MTATTNHNKKLTAALTRIGQTEKKRGNVLLFRAYLMLVVKLKNHPTQITSGKEAQEAMGIGAGLAGKIQDLLDESDEAT